jgi:hypothetical protein
MQQFQLRLFDGTEFSNSAWTFQRKPEEVELEFQSAFFNMKVQDSFPFLALNKIRLKLEGIGIKILCHGARIDVYPSGMLLTTVKAYEIEMGQKATKMIVIFDPTDDIHKIATVEEQKAYFDSWFVSIPV